MRGLVEDFQHLVHILMRHLVTQSLQDRGPVVPQNMMRREGDLPAHAIPVTQCRLALADPERREPQPPLDILFVILRPPTGQSAAPRPVQLRLQIFQGQLHLH
ncbi:TPA: hypothetical protein DCE37_09630 [Candidatus Latescibacteria bacterium]|nr:hypothetical protein [Candidatus Latescibacterota bacterium]